MKIKINGEVIETRAVWMDEDYNVEMIDQRLIPWRVEIFKSDNYQKTAWAIKEMVVRGAPSIGVTAGYAFVQAVKQSKNSNDLVSDVEKKMKEIESTRPTAVNLKNALEYLWGEFLKLVKENIAFDEIVAKLKEKADFLSDREVEANKKIGEFGEKLIKNGYRILTHCNAGALAAVDIGTTLAPIRFAHKNGKDIFVYVDETRPRLQGARLTAWELANEGIKHAIIADNAAGFYMWRGEVDMVIVGADRITMNGDVANKIGTYKLALAAKENGVPFYVAAPLTTFDRMLKDGRDIPIEERSEEEVLYVRGSLDNGELVKVRIAPIESRALNPAFDVTPFKYVTGIITEKGILRSVDDIRRVLG